MIGSQHFREAERLLTEAGEVTRPYNGLSDDESATIARIILAKAQVHATLALAAATGVPESFASLKVQWRREAGLTL